MGWTLPTASKCQVEVLKPLRGGVRGKVSIIGLDLAKSVFQAHGADASGTGNLPQEAAARPGYWGSLRASPACLVAMEACASAHYWAPEIVALGHDTRLIAPAYVKPFVKRQNDAADVDAAHRGGLAPDDAVRGRQEHQAQGRPRCCSACETSWCARRTRTISAVRSLGHLAEFGVVVARAPDTVAKALAQARACKCERASLGGFKATSIKNLARNSGTTRCQKGDRPPAAATSPRLVGFRRCGRGPQRDRTPGADLPPALALWRSVQLSTLPRASPLPSITLTLTPLASISGVALQRVGDTALDIDRAYMRLDSDCR